MSVLREVFLGIGSNVNARQNILAGIDALNQKLGGGNYSSVYQTQAAGFDGDDFLNLVGRFSTTVALEELLQFIKTIEYSFGRRKESGRFSPKALDIDVLLYGDLRGQHADIDLPREEITQSIYVLKPLAEINPNLRLDDSDVSLSSMLSSFSGPQLNIRCLGSIKRLA